MVSLRQILHSLGVEARNAQQKQGSPCEERGKEPPPPQKKQQQGEKINWPRDVLEARSQGVPAKRVVKSALVIGLKGEGIEKMHLCSPEGLIASESGWHKPCFCPLPKRGRFDENGENDEFAFCPLKTRVSLRPPKTMKVTKWRMTPDVTQAKAWFRRSRVCSCLSDGAAKLALR